MNAEELKMILEAVSAVSGDAKSVLIWYFAGKYGVSVLHSLGMLGALVGVAHIVAKTVRDINHDGQRMRDICDRLDLSYYRAGTADIIKAVEAKVKGASK